MSSITLDNSLLASFTQQLDAFFAQTPVVSPPSSEDTTDFSLPMMESPIVDMQEPYEIQVLVHAGDDEDQAWEDTVMAARALDDIEEAARTGMWADAHNYDAPDNAELSDGEASEVSGSDSDSDADSEDDDGNYYDDRYYDYDDWDYDGPNYGLDYNESGYFD